MQKNEEINVIDRACDNKSMFPVKYEDLKTIYIVDDDMDDRFFCQMHLRQSKFISDVKTFESASCLFKHFEQTGVYDRPHLNYENTVLLLDIHMPSVNGIEILDYIRTHPITTDMDVILLTSDVSSDKIYEAYKLQATGYLQKPFSLKEFDKILIKQLTQDKKLFS